MSKVTKNYGFEKPEQSDYYDVAVFNNNFDKIDTVIKDVEDSVPEVVVDWNDIENKPNTVAGYLIQDGVSVNDAQLYPRTLLIGKGRHVIGNSLVAEDDVISLLEDVEALKSDKVDKSTKINNYSLSSDITITKADLGLNNVDNTADKDKSVALAQTANHTSFNGITNKPTTINGYGITDAVEKGMRNPPSTAYTENIAGIYDTTSIYTGPSGAHEYGYVQVPIVDSAAVQILADYNAGGALYFRKLETGAGTWKKVMTDSDLTVESGTFDLTASYDSTIKTTGNIYSRIGNLVYIAGTLPQNFEITSSPGTWARSIQGLPFPAGKDASFFSVYNSGMLAGAITSTKISLYVVTEQTNKPRGLVTYTDAIGGAVSETLKITSTVSFTATYMI